MLLLLDEATMTGAVVTVAGHVYADGRASIEEVAAMLDLDVPDTVALLEERGFRRSVDGLRLTGEARRERLRRIREDRLGRGGQPALSEPHVVRDVIASQRIEGIDARAWARQDWPRGDGDKLFCALVTNYLARCRDSAHSAFAGPTDGPALRRR